MSDLLSDARELRQKLYRLEVLLQIEKGRRSRGWFTGKAPEDPQRAAARREALVLRAPRPFALEHAEVGFDTLSFHDALRNTLRQAPDAMRDLLAGHARGKLVLTM